MAANDNPSAEPGSQPATTSTSIPIALALGAAALAAGGVVLAVAVTWGAAEAAVGVGAAYLVYTALTDQQKNLAGLLAVRLVGGFHRVPEASGSPPAPD
jgi:hypothetical protein